MNPLSKLLSSITSENIYYIPNPGNAGDSVIAAATYQYFDGLGLSYCTPNPHSFNARGKVVVYGGGGNLVGSGTFSHKFISRHHLDAKRLIVLPHTIKHSDELLMAMGTNVDLFCRESTSFEYVTSLTHDANVYHTDDMAFLLDANRIRDTQVKSVWKSCASYVINKLNSFENQPCGEHLRNRLTRRSRIERIQAKFTGPFINCFRLDGESSGLKIPEENIDVSQVFQYGVETKEAAYVATQDMFLFLNRFDRVSTDRLHVAISSALLGKEVYFYPNNYFKCKAVYEYSMKDKYQNVVWKGA